MDIINKDEVGAFVFIAGVAAIGITNLLLFQLSRDYHLKRRLYPCVMGLICAGIPVGVGCTGKVNFKTFLLYLLIGLVTYIANVRQIRFCRECGATNNNPLWLFHTMKFCRACGSAFRRHHHKP